MRGLALFVAGALAGIAVTAAVAQSNLSPNKGVVGMNHVGIIVPDLETIVQEYNGQQPFGALSQKDLAKPAADRLNERLLMRSGASPRRTLYWLYDSWNDFHSHKWMYDLTSLTHLLRSAGFVGLERKGSGESAIENIAAVEDPSRILNGAGICVEGRKP